MYRVLRLLIIVCWLRESVPPSYFGGVKPSGIGDNQERLAGVNLKRYHCNVTHKQTAIIFRLIILIFNASNLLNYSFSSCFAGQRTVITVLTCVEHEKKICNRNLAQSDLNKKKKDRTKATSQSTLDVKHLTDHQCHTVSGQYGLDLREGAAS